MQYTNINTIIGGKRIIKKIFFHSVINIGQILSKYFIVINFR